MLCLRHLYVAVQCAESRPCWRERLTDSIGLVDQGAFYANRACTARISSPEKDPEMCLRGEK